MHECHRIAYARATQSYQLKFGNVSQIIHSSPTTVNFPTNKPKLFTIKTQVYNKIPVLAIFRIYTLIIPISCTVVHKKT